MFGAKFLKNCRSVLQSGRSYRDRFSSLGKNLMGNLKKGETMGMYTIAVANQKGGSGKTTTAVNLSACLAEKGHRVLLVDLDPQAQASTCWKIEELEPKGTVFDMILETRDPDRPLVEIGHQVGEGLTLLPSENISTADEARLLSQPRQFDRLGEWLNKVRGNYDFAIIDCPPTLGVLTQSALKASDAVLLTVETSFLALHGVGRILETIKSVRTENPIRVFALATMYDGRTNFANEVLEDMQDYFGDMMLKTVIRENVRLKEAASCGVPITEYCHNSYGAEDYTTLTKELLKKI
jgi:chromosome partitioning protein